MITVTCIAPVNIAVIKYWGKRDEDLILPLNDSVSATLSTDHLCTKTTISTCASFTENRIVLNGKTESFENPRLLRCLQEIKKRVASSESGKKDILNWKVHVQTENNFPTAAGLASSASGYACLVYTLAHLYGIEKDEISSIARQGSGSACRSLYGGFVQWRKGDLLDGSDSIAVQLTAHDIWPEMRIVILVVNDTRKKTSSTSGMSTSVKTSKLLKYRTESCVPKHTRVLVTALNNKDFQTFGRITMQDSNQFHAVCLDTYPPCVYMNDVSHEIVNMVHQFNDLKNEIRVAYTFDAGPNACLYLLEKDVPELLAVVNRVFPNDKLGSPEYIKGISVDVNDLPEASESFSPNQNNLIKYIINTKVGEGPKRVI
ncbi:diphosphomevalonate decarboxylase [Toxorhynchites rutilus septentrionalis]|uniref:diphosphomevalonate decarboxylase n=1 Tax=Toxorhynchites rutilus septentrionalis TaxID=329112 RepID=UPI00247A9D86|nr:diphosphomevalonate decarboxylase [Toxorhynchites rutilus septentrionalis]